MAPLVERRLAAILAADVVGYSTLIEADEAGTLDALRAMRRDALGPLLAEHRGRIAKLMGDGIIVAFGSVVSAVACAAALRERLATAQGDVTPERRIVLRIGVHLGDVVVEGEDLLGDGVNVAARLEQLCPPGGILISAAAHDQLPGKFDLAFEDAGEQSLKNIARPVRAFRLRPEGTPAQPTTATQVGEKPAVAVLPFENMSGDPDQIYFSDGITEDVITDLSRFRELMVIARNSSFAFRGKSMDVREIGRALGAAYVIEGNVRRAGHRVRITAQLIDADSGAHVWAERYDRAIEDVFAVQEEIAQSIVATVAQRVFDAGEIAARRRPPQDIRAYDLLLKGMRLSDTFTPEGQARVEAFYEQARAIDPTFARAYTGLAYVHNNRSVDVIAGVQPQPDEHRLSALRLAEQALALDPNDPRVHSTLAMMSTRVRDFERAERHYDLARAMNPNDATIQIYWAWAQACFGRPEDGLPAADLAFRLNPRHPRWYSEYLSRILFLLRRYEEAATRLEFRMRDAPTQHRRDIAWLAAAYGLIGRSDLAKQCAAWLVEGLGQVWRGDPYAGPREYVDWMLDNLYLRRPEDEELVREGLRRAGLPA